MGGQRRDLDAQEGNDGLEKFLEEVDYWLVKYRRKGGHIWVRHFINLFAYECKVSFLRCFANAWIDLIPWLKEHRGLDPLSERFLRVWHNQNQPVEIPHGRTAGGVLYPTRAGAVILTPGDSGGAERRQFDWETERLGPTHLRDAFNGQILSLHPLSGFFMQDRAVCEIAGTFFSLDDFEELGMNGRLGQKTEYWNFIGVILLAAHQYRLAVERQEQKRGHRQQLGGDASDAIKRDDAPPAEPTLWEDYAVDHELVCPSCQNELSFDRRVSPAIRSKTATVHYRCTECGERVEERVREADLASWLGCDRPDGRK